MEVQQENRWQHRRKALQDPELMKKVPGSRQRSRREAFLSWRCCHRRAASRSPAAASPVLGAPGWGSSTAAQHLPGRGSTRAPPPHGTRGAAHSVVPKQARSSHGLWAAFVVSGPGGNRLRLLTRAPRRVGCLAATRPRSKPVPSRGGTSAGNARRRVVSAPRPPPVSLPEQREGILLFPC